MTALHVYATPIRACRTPLWWTPLGRQVDTGLAAAEHGEPLGTAEGPQFRQAAQVALRRKTDIL